MEKEKLQNIAFMKTIMMILICIYHSMLFFNSGWFTYVEPIYSARYLIILAKWLNTFHIQTFCMASGFIYYYLKVEKHKYNNFKVDIFNKAKRLLVPYLFTCVFWVIPIAIYFFRYGWKDIIIRYIFMDNPNQLWFLIMLFGVFSLFFAVLNKIKFNIKNLVLFYIVCTTLSIASSVFSIKLFQIQNVIQYCLFFYYGGYIYFNKEKITKKELIISIIILIAVLGAYFCLSRYNHSTVTIIIKLMYPLISLIEIFVIYFLCTSFVKTNKRVLNSKIYKLLEENSFGIYLFHQQIIYFIIVLLNGHVHPLIQVLVSFIVSLGISLIMSILLKKNKVTKIMFGL